ncbi:competence type IV pilus minor pilin ComGE [Streptococcus moroccensis]|uniref:Type II secretory pathway pseudopilin PulG n=1 Tax=Streptococcus moroccensis TaxID=1451356 RepID=A0ABT9YU95_9STRE|nr:competence type IV pilus minor pilin ComGE [Streptococcus moroccensis]MDQ0222933.1 type II secretory pathway pseudopilin PulG [Streptococcus moroccensis]
MVNIKKQQIKAYILLESLIATALFALLVGVVLTEIDTSRARQNAYLQQEEGFQVAKMALQTGVDQLSLNGQEIVISRKDKGLEISQKGDILVSINEQ